MLCNNRHIWKRLCPLKRSSGNFCNISFLFQVWEHTPQRLLRHKQSGLCLDSKDVKSGEHVTTDNCDNNKYSQIWQFSLTMV